LKLIKQTLHLIKLSRLGEPSEESSSAFIKEATLVTGNLWWILIKCRKSPTLTEGKHVAEFNGKFQSAHGWYMMVEWILSGVIDTWSGLQPQLLRKPSKTATKSSLSDLDLNSTAIPARY
jgi:hypothetical protein